MSRLVFFDLETGGVLPQHPNIQLAAVAIDTRDWSEVGSFERKIQFEESAASPEALTLNHYDPELWAKEAHPEGAVLIEFSHFLKQHATLEMVSGRTGKPYSVARLAGYNAATFDGPRLKEAFAANDLFLPAHPIVLCVMQRVLWHCQDAGLKLDNVKLATACSYFGVSLDGAHDALADVRATAALARALREVRAAA